MPRKNKRQPGHIFQSPNNIQSLPSNQSLFFPPVHHFLKDASFALLSGLNNNPTQFFFVVCFFTLGYSLLCQRHHTLPQSTKLKSYSSITPNS